MTEEDGFFALELAPAGGACPTALRQPSLPFARLQTALGLRPRRDLSSAGATDEITVPQTNGNRPRHYSAISEVGLDCLLGIESVYEWTIYEQI
jgi:hypothetical protein